MRRRIFNYGRNIRMTDIQPTTLAEMVQAEINAIERPFMRRVLQRRYDRNPSAILDEVRTKLYLSADPKLMQVAAEEPNYTIDPEIRKMIIDIIKQLLPIILALFL